MNLLPRRTLTLALAGSGSLLIYTGALLQFPLLSIYNTPLQNLDRLTGSAPQAGLALLCAVLLLFGGYGLGALGLKGRGSISLPTRLLLLGVPVVAVGLLLFVYPTTSLDVYDYLFRGRMAVRYGANNFVQVPADFQNDPLIAAQPFRFIPWHRAVTAYGPLWEWLSAGTAWLAGERPGRAPATIDPSLRSLIVGYKELGALGFFACGAAIWLVLRRAAPEQRWLGLYLWLWNPLALWESVAAAHNDAWMMAAIVLAIGTLRAAPRPKPFGNQGGYPGMKTPERAAGRRLRSGSETPVFWRAVGAFLALTIGALIKYLALIFGPLLLAASLRRLPGWRARLGLLVAGAAVCGGAVVLAYAPFWQGAATLRNFSDRGTLFYASPIAVFEALAQEGGLSKVASQSVASLLATLLLAGGVLFSAWRGWRAPERVPAHALGLLLWFLLVANPWFQPWYLLWALALVAVQPGNTRAVQTVVLFSLTAMLSYLAGSFLLPALGWAGESAAWNGLLTTLIYVPPLLALLRGQLLPQQQADARALA